MKGFFAAALAIPAMLTQAATVGLKQQNANVSYKAPSKPISP